MLTSMYANTNTNTSTVNLQLREDHFAEKCVCEEQVQVFQPKLSPIKRPEAEDNVSEVSPDTDFKDSGNEKTNGINNSFHSTNLSEHE
ncbi:unnamed protein product [Tenebrio molitor]|nr:unnamed protein product [Tenebrio molitor]